MLNIIILILFIHILFTGDSTILACGVFAFLSNSADKLDWTKFNTLGLFNDSRGGDSCGRVTEDFVEYGMTLESDYKDFTINHGSPLVKYRTVLGHTRKASVGQVKKEFAQPVVFSSETKFVKKKKGRDKILKEFLGKDDKERIIFAGVHNGTIVNHTALAKKYEIDDTDKNDSIILMEILCRRGFDVLLDYIGTAALIWHDFITDTTYAFHGKCATYPANKGKADVATEEKPLYMYTESDNTIYLSSTDDSLRFIGGSDKNVEELQFNTLYAIKNGSVENMVLYDRLNLSSQKEPWVSTYGDGWSNKNSKTYNTYDDFDNGRISNDAIPVKWASGMFLNPKLLDGRIHIFWEKHDAYLQGDTVFFWKGRYWVAPMISLNDIPVLANGVFYLDVTGAKCKKSNSSAQLYYFIYGVMIVNRELYEKTLLDVSRSGSEIELVKILSAVSYYPVHSFDKNIKGSTISMIGSTVSTYQNFFKPSRSEADVTNRVGENSIFFSGTFKPMFSKRTYVIVRGDLVGINDDSFFKLGKKRDVVEPDTKADNEFADFPDCPCDNCNLLHTNSNACLKCKDYDDYLDVLTEYKNKHPLEAIKKDGNQETLFECSQLSDEDLTYKDLVVERTAELIEEGIEGVQDLLTSLSELDEHSPFYSTVVTTLEEIKKKYEHLKTSVEYESK